MKKIIALLLVLAMALSLAACGGNGGSSKTTLNIVAAEYGTQTKAWWGTFETDFEAANNDIDLVIDVVSWNDINTVVNTRIANNDGPDILNTNVFAAWQAEGLLLPAEEYISETTYAKFYKAFLENSVVDGTVWAVPDLASCRALYYNADILKEVGVDVPKTWDELVSVSEKIIAHYNGEVYPWGVDMTTDEGQACFAYYIWNNGGDFVDADGNWTLNSPENVEAIEFVIDMYNKGLTNTSPATETRYANQDMLGAGKVAMMIGPNSIPTYLKDGGYDINWGVADIPSNNGTSVAAGVMDRFMCFDNDYSDAEMAAIEKFFDFFYEDTRYSEWVLMEGFLPATTAGGEAMAAADPANAAWIEIVGTAKFYPDSNSQWDDVQTGVRTILQQALQGEDVQTLLDNLQQEIAG